MSASGLEAASRLKGACASSGNQREQENGACEL